MVIHSVLGYNFLPKGMMFYFQSYLASTIQNVLKLKFSTQGSHSFFFSQFHSTPKLNICGLWKLFILEKKGWGWDPKSNTRIHEGFSYWEKSGRAILLCHSFTPQDFFKQYFPFWFIDRHGTYFFIIWKPMRYEYSWVQKVTCLRPGLTEQYERDYLDEVFKKW